MPWINKKKVSSVKNPFINIQGFSLSNGNGFKLANSFFFELITDAYIRKYDMDMDMPC